MANHNPKPFSKESEWSQKDLTILEKKYPTEKNEAIATLLNRTVGSIRAKATILKLKKANTFWQHEDEQFVIKNWNVMSYQEIGDHLGRTKWAVINKYRELTNKRNGHKKLPIL